MSRTVLDDLLSSSTIQWNDDQMSTLKRVNVVLLAKVYDKMEQGKAPDEILVDLINLQEGKEDRLRREIDRRKVEDSRKAQETSRDAAGRGNFAGLQFFKGLEATSTPQPIERPVPKGYRPPRKSNVAATTAPGDKPAAKPRKSTVGVGAGAADKASSIADKAAAAGAKAGQPGAAKPAAGAPKTAPKAAAGSTTTKSAAAEGEEPSKKKRVVRKVGKKAAGEAAAEDDATGVGLETAGGRRKDVTEDTQADLLAALQKRKRIAKVRALMASGGEVSAEAVALVKSLDAGEPVDEGKIDEQLSKFVELDEEELAEVEAEVALQMEELAPSDEETPENLPEDLEEGSMGTDDTSRPNKGRSTVSGQPEDEEGGITGDNTKQPSGKPDKPQETLTPTDEDEPLEEGDLEEDFTKEPSGNPDELPEDEDDEPLDELGEEDLEKLGAEDDENPETPEDEDDVSLTESEIGRLEAEMAQEMELADLEESDDEPDLPEESPDDDLPPELLEELTEEEQKWLDEDDHRVDFGAPNEEDPMEMAANDEDDERDRTEQTVWESDDDSW